MGVADRFLPTLEDQLAGVGPRGGSTSIRPPFPASAGTAPPTSGAEPVLRRARPHHGAGGSIGGGSAGFVAVTTGATLVTLNGTSETARFANPPPRRRTSRTTAPVRVDVDRRHITAARSVDRLHPPRSSTCP